MLVSNNALAAATVLAATSGRHLPRLRLRAVAATAVQSLGQVQSFALVKVWAAVASSLPSHTLGSMQADLLRIRGQRAAVHSRSRCEAVCCAVGCRYAVC